MQNIFIWTIFIVYSGQFLFFDIIKYFCICYNLFTMGCRMLSACDRKYLVRENKLFLYQVQFFLICAATYFFWDANYFVLKLQIMLCIVYKVFSIETVKQFLYKMFNVFFISCEICFVWFVKVFYIENLQYIL